MGDRRSTCPQGSLRKLWLEQAPGAKHQGKQYHSAQRIASLLIPALPLALLVRLPLCAEGYVFGNPRILPLQRGCNPQSTRFVLALMMRLWQIGGYLHLWS